MNIQEYLKLAKRVLKEDAGSEGMQYMVEAKSGLTKLENDLLTIDEVKTVNGVTSARVTFAYPHDYGFALNAIKENLKNVEITSLSLVY